VAPGVTVPSLEQISGVTAPAPAPWTPPPPGIDPESLPSAPVVQPQPPSSPATQMYDLTPYGVPGMHEMTPAEYAAAVEQWTVSQGGAPNAPPPPPPPPPVVTNPPPVVNNPPPVVNEPPPVVNEPPPVVNPPPGTPPPAPVSPPPTQQQLDDVWNKPNQSNAPHTPVPIPTWQNAPPPAWNAIPVGLGSGIFGGKGYAGMLGGSNYILGLMNRFLPGIDPQRTAAGRLASRPSTYTASGGGPSSSVGGSGTGTSSSTSTGGMFGGTDDKTKTSTEAAPYGRDATGRPLTYSEWIAMQSSGAGGGP
jgi:hypothetical protein